MAEQYNLEYMYLRGEGVGNLNLGMHMVFGIYPLIYIEDSSFDSLLLDMKLTVQMVGK